jgi:CRP/FNR family transcriptional regulator
MFMALSSDRVSLLSLPALAPLMDKALRVEHAPGDSLFSPGEPCVHLPVLLSGVAKVYVSNDGNRRVTLYRLRPQAICPISLSALLQNSPYPAGAVAEGHLQVRYLPGDQLKSLIRESQETFSALLESFAGCVYESVRTARHLMFAPLDVRLAQMLRNRFTAAPDQAIALSHEELANEIGTSRVVVSRLLKRLEHANCIRLRRREIALNDPAVLDDIIEAARQPARRAGVL